MKGVFLTAVFAGVVAAAASASCSGNQGGGATYDSRATLLDSTTCQKCHADHFRDWSGSMHAYASDDPIFLAMNARGQRETGGALGDFCVQCHAPMAVHDGKTSDGTNLASVAAPYKGVTCYFCHTVDGVQGANDNPLHLAGDVTMRGPFADPVANAAHPAAYSAFLDRERLESASLCGTCHDIENGHGVSIERTFQEWQASVYNKAPGGQTCAECHMKQSDDLEPVAQAPNVFARYFHAHDFPGVDTALTDFPQSDAQKQGVTDFLDQTLKSALCVGQGSAGMSVLLDNVFAGHSWPSGSAQDRRAWIELIAYSNGMAIYQSGVVADGQAVTTLQDPDLWLLRDCMLDGQGNQVSMFWQAASPSESYLLPGAATSDALDPAYYLTHVYQTFPRSTPLTAAPDRVTMRVRIQPVGLDVVDDLIASGDLDPSFRAKISTFDVGTQLEWTPATGEPGYTDDNRVPYTCVTASNASYIRQMIATPHTHCKP